MPFVTSIPASRVPGVYFRKLGQPAVFPGTASDLGGVVMEAARGPVNTLVIVESLSEWVATFGGKTTDAAGTVLSGYLAARTYFHNGGGRLASVRQYSVGMATGHVTLLAGATAVVDLQAETPGSWAAGLAISVSVNADGTFTLAVVDPATGRTGQAPGLSLANNAALITAINNATGLSGLIAASQPVVGDPVAVPTATPSGTGSTLAAGVYKGVMTYLPTGGAAGGKETLPSPEFTVTVSAGQQLVATLPVQTGAVGAALYLTPANGAAGSEVLAGQNAAGLTVTLTAPPPASTLRPPVLNTATTGAGSTAGTIVAGTLTIPASGAGAAADGLRLSSVQAVGQGATPVSGLNVLATGAGNSKPLFAWIAGPAGGDTTTWQAQADLAAANDWIAVLALPQGTPEGQATATGTAEYIMAQAAQTTLLASPSAPNAFIAYPWIVVQEPEDGAPLTIPPMSAVAGIWAHQPNAVAPFYKPMPAILQPEFTPTFAQATNLSAVGINPIGTLLIGGQGLLTGVMLEGTDAAVARVTYVIMRAAAVRAATYIGFGNTATLRDHARSSFLSLLDSFADDGTIPANPAASGQPTPVTPATTGARRTGAAVPQPATGATTTASLNYAVICDDSNNLDAQGNASERLYVQLLVKPAPNVRAVVIDVAINPTVVITAAQAA